MSQPGEQQGLALECIGGLDQFLCGQAGLAHLLDSHQAVAKLHIRRFIDRAKTALAHLLQNAIALFEQVIVDEQTGTLAALATLLLQRLAAGIAIQRIGAIGRAAAIAIEWRSHHEPELPLQAGKTKATARASLSPRTIHRTSAW